ncbi:Very low-density lipoprotein receptor [Thelohanellus kitauei]|uniref:Very low-density lipoprotein receptor n=1 Tax=Thelohanellus kitauei TaxID=669202 RepID=A0A0C2N2S9_THEKT|nr:Very low-density lipoprotein receptor [Thelohanellus kitauei]
MGRLIFSCQTRFSVKSPLFKPKHCQDGESCYSESQICDGFNDCSDGSDQKNCHSKQRCIGNKFFKCGSNSKICVYKVCNGDNDCEDGSDEGQKCHKIDNIKNIHLQILEKGTVSFSWIHGHSTGQSYVTIQNIDTKDTKRRTVTRNVIKFDGHINCGRYLVLVKMNGRLIKYRHYVYVDNIQESTPYILEYYFITKVLKWEADVPPCRSYVFYIECCRDTQLVARSFSEVPFLKQNLNSGDVCRVSTCRKSM